MTAPVVPEADRSEIERFMVLFRHATPGSWVAARAYYHKASGPRQTMFIESVRVDHPHLLNQLEEKARRVARIKQPAAFYLPIATFKEPGTAKTIDVVDGLAISIECDTHPDTALRAVRSILGDPTLVVASGGTWTDVLGIGHPKIHIHCRLKVPARDKAAFMMLAEARSLVRQLAKSDPTCDPMVHPLRLAGSQHRKAAAVPRLAWIVEYHPDCEIDLETALAALRAAVPNPEGRLAPNESLPDDLLGSTEDLTSALEALPNNSGHWDEYRKLMMASWAASQGDGLEAFLVWSRKSWKHDEEVTYADLDHITYHPPNRIGFGTIVHLVKAAVPSWISPSFKATRKDERTNGRPTIRLQAGEVEATVDQAEDALIARGGLYQREHLIVAIGQSPVLTADRKTVSVSRIFERGEYALAEDLASAAVVERFDQRTKDFVVVNPPIWIVRTLREREGRLRFPILTNIIHAPTIRSNGTLLSSPGYDAETGLYMDTRGTRFPEIKTSPIRAEAEGALHELKQLIKDFSFEGEADRAVALSGILTACSRQGLGTAPVHGFSAPVAGSGKSNLVDIASVISTGQEAGVISQGQNEEELEKRLGALLLAGETAISIDNCETALGGEFLCQLVTQKQVRTRILGLSKVRDLSPKAFISCTGNNLSIKGDMTRRTLLCRLDPGVERPELRRFDADPIKQASAGRGAYVAAALTIILAYRSAGYPSCPVPLGSFEDWSRSVRGALMWLGEADPVNTMETARATDPRLDELTAVLSQWRDVIGRDPVTTGQVITRCIGNTDLREALLTVAGQGDTINSRRLGKWLGGNAKRIVNGVYLEKSGVREGNSTWKLQLSQSGGADPVGLGGFR